MDPSPDFGRLIEMISFHARENAISEARLVDDVIGFLDHRVQLENDLLEGIRQAERGMGRPVNEWMAELAAAHDLGYQPARI